MITTLRAGLSVLMLGGFYVLALGLVGGFAALAVWAWNSDSGGGSAKFAYVAIALGAGIGAALYKVFTAKPAPPEGLPVRPDEAPELWGMVGDLARQVGTRAPDEIRLLPEVNAAVSEESKLLGLAGGRRYMYIGLPLAQAFTVSQLRSVLAHELGHYSHSHTRLGALAHRGRMTIVATIQQIGPKSIAGRLFRGYARLYVLVEQAVSRRQEYEADEASVRIAGREAATTAMRDIPVVDAAWNFYLRGYIGQGWESGYAPKDVFGGFSQLLAGRAGELERMRGDAPPSERSKWDSHPPIADRIRAMALMPEPDGVRVDTRPATALFPDFDRFAARLQEATIAVEGRELLSWDELTATAALANGQRDADVLFRAAARVAGVPQGDLGTVLDLIAAGRAGELSAAVNPHADAGTRAEELAGLVGVAIAVAAVKSGVASWKHSWTGPRQLLDADGKPLPVDEVASLATHPAMVDEARERLGRMGIDIAAAVQASEKATATGADLLGGLANMKSGDGWLDVFILDRGLVLVPGPKSTDNGKDRLVGIMQEAGSVTKLAERHRFVAYEEIASATIVKKVPVRVDITLHSGETIQMHHTWTGESLAKDSDEVLRQAMAPFAGQQ